MKKTVLITALICFFVMPFAYGQAIPNPGFESWVNYGLYQDPVGWKSLDSLAHSFSLPMGETKDSLNPHSGSYDIQLYTNSVAGQPIPSAACTGNFNLITISPLTYTITGGFPTTSKRDSLKGFYRAIIGASDSVYIISFYTKWDAVNHKRDTVAYGYKAVGVTTPAWTPFAFKIYDDSIPAVAPDSGIVLLVSCRPAGGVGGTTLWVDDLSFSAGINEVDALNGNYDLYPNPVVGTLYIKNNNFFKKAGFITIYDEMGKKVSTSNLNDNTSVVNTKSLAKGIYFYEIMNTNQAVVKKGKFIVEQ